MGVILIYKIYWKTSAVSTTCLMNGWNSILQAAWYIRHVRIIWFLWTKHTIWLLILSFTQNIVRACSMFYRGYRSVTPLDAARANRTIFHNHSVHWYYITLIKGRDYIKHDIIVDMVKRTRVEGGGYIKHIIAWYEVYWLQMGFWGHIFRFRIAIRFSFFELCSPWVRAAGKPKDDKIDQHVYLTPVDISKAHGGRLASDSAVARHIVFLDLFWGDGIRKFLPEPKRQ